MSTRIPIVPGDGRPAWFQDSEDYGRLVVMPEVCEGIDPRLWDLFAVEEPLATAPIDHAAGVLSH